MSWFSSTRLKWNTRLSSESFTWPWASFWRRLTIYTLKTTSTFSLNGFRKLFSWAWLLGTLAIVKLRYMSFLIIIKWLTDWTEYGTFKAPSIINTMINFPLALGSTAGFPYWDIELPADQKHPQDKLQFVFLSKFTFVKFSVGLRLRSLDAFLQTLFTQVETREKLKSARA